jgi:hypothetical protein
MEKQVDVAFLVLAHTDGTFAVKLEDLTTPVETNRIANTGDVFGISQQITKEIEQQLLVSRIVDALNPQVQSVPDVIKEKLAERGIQAESTEPTE